MPSSAGNKRKAVALDAAPSIPEKKRRIEEADGSNKDKIERTPKATDTATPSPGKKLHISPVDRFNVPTNGPSAEPASYSDHSSADDFFSYETIMIAYEYFGYQGVRCHRVGLPDAEGETWPVPFVLFREFSKSIRWRGVSQNKIRQAEDGLLVSPGSIATFEEMSACERENFWKWEDEQDEADPDKYDPDTMFAFYDGILRLYGRRQVP